MFGLGTMANALAVIVGGVLGTIFGKALGARMRGTVMAAFSGSVMFVAVVFGVLS